MSASQTQHRTRWWWIRHAPVPQLADRIYGSTDPDADVSDTQRFTQLAQHLPAQATWIVSSLRRTHQTAQAIETAGYHLPDLLSVVTMSSASLMGDRFAPRLPTHSSSLRYPPFPYLLSPYH